MTTSPIDTQESRLSRLLRMNIRLAGQPRPIRAALLSPGLAMGGAERWVVSLARYADPGKLLWTGAAISSLGGTDESLCRELGRHTRLHAQTPDPKFRNPDRPFHVEHFHKVHANWPAAVAAACAGADVVVAWGSVQSVGMWLKPLDIPGILVSHTTEQEPQLAPLSDIRHLAAVSRAAAGYFADRVGRDQFPDVQIVYNGADLERCQEINGRVAQRTDWGLADETVAIGYLGREAREKNFLCAAQAAIALGPGYTAIYHSALVGRPDSHDPELTALQQSSPGRVQLFLPRTEIGDILAGLDVLVLASHREAFSLCLIEAWLTGVPVVATPVGSLPELQERFQTALAIEVPMNPTPQQLADAVRRANGPEGREIAETARRIALKFFTCEAMMNQWTDWLSEIVREHRLGNASWPVRWLGRGLASLAGGRHR